MDDTLWFLVIAGGCVLGLWCVSTLYKAGHRRGYEECQTEQYHREEEIRQEDRLTKIEKAIAILTGTEEAKE